MMFPLVRELAADGIPVAVTCRVLKFSRQAFYAWNADPLCDRDHADAVVTNAAVDVYRDDPEFGYRFIADELVAAGHRVSERRVWRLCSQAGLVSTVHRRRGKTIKSGPPVHDDLVERDFTAESPNRLWLTDITEHHTREGKLYLRAIKDVNANRIVGYSIDSRMKARLAVTALSNAATRRGDIAGCVVHSARGSQFQSRKYLAALEFHGANGSMGRVGACGDNAAIESFFSLLQKNVLDRQPWATRQELRTAIVTWIERTYHRRRRQQALGKLTPIEFEMIYTDRSHGLTITELK